MPCGPSCTKSQLLTPIFSTFSVAWGIAQIIIGADNEPCDQPLPTWLLVQGISNLGIFLFNIAVILPLIIVALQSCDWVSSPKKLYFYFRSFL
jgi:hypothetical protein